MIIDMNNFGSEYELIIGFIYRLKYFWGLLQFASQVTNNLQNFDSTEQNNFDETEITPNFPNNGSLDFPKFS